MTKKIMVKSIFYLLLILNSFLLCGTIPEQERAALIALYNSTNGDDWSWNDGWKIPPLHTDGFAMPGTEGNWYGVTISGDHVTKLDLSGSSLSGSIPSQLGNLSNLKLLNLFHNNLSGPIPPELGKLGNLDIFDLSSNNLSGNIPPEWGNLKKLGRLRLDNNRLSGIIPNELGNLSKLKSLNLNHNRLSGGIPSQLGNLSLLTSLELSSNELSGGIPPELGNLNDLQTLGLNYNRLSGHIPPGFGNLLQLKNIILCGNQLSGGIPSELGNLTNLSYFNLSSNQLSGSIPSELGNLANLSYFDLSSNELSGSIPSELGDLANLSYFDLSCNELSGSIPSQLGKLSNLKKLIMYNNQLSGSIPPEIGNLSNLKILDFYNNQLSGALPSQMGNLNNLLQIILSHNDLSGDIPSELGNLPKLINLNFSQNRLSGTIPSQLSNLQGVKELYLDHNKLSGTIPPGLGDLKKLGCLYLDNNELSGSIPSELGNMSNLTHLSLGYNQLSGTIPQGLSNIENLWGLYLDNNQLSGSIPSELMNLTNLHELSLGNNQLSGSIPPELGKLIRMEYLNISHNQLSGVIPSSFLKLTRITRLDIGYNCLSVADPALRNWLNRNDPDWGTTQTQCGGTNSKISLSHSQLNFGAIIPGSIPDSQTVLIRNIGSGTLNWSAFGNADWLSFTPSSGTGDWELSVSVNPTGLAIGNYTGSVIITDPNASNSPQTITVILNVYEQGRTSTPFGEFATPLEGSSVCNSIPVTGWVLDDIGVANVKIYNGDIYIGDAVFVEGARPDVEAVYPTYPNSYKAGWGYMLLTQGLPNGGNGTYTLIAKATDMEGNEVTLDSKTITIDNAHAEKPFGSIDTPGQGGTASGSDFFNWGWVLTPPPNRIPISGDTIDVYVDGINLGHPFYNYYRSDVASLFPGYANSGGAAGFFLFDTTAYANGIHTISWVAVDDAGNRDGIGSRYFSIANLGSSDILAAYHTFSSKNYTPKELELIQVKDMEPVQMVSGFEKNCVPREILPDNSGTARINLKELERVEIHLGENITSLQGYMVMESQLRDLPIGSTLDLKTGKFYWIPGPGYIGTYLLVFVIEETSGQCYRRKVEITIEPKYL